MKTRLSVRLFKELAQLAGQKSDLLGELGVELAAMPTQLYPFEAVEDAVKKVTGEGIFEDADRENWPGNLGRAISSILYTVSTSYTDPEELIRITVLDLDREYPKASAEIEKFLRTLLASKKLLLSFKATSLHEDNDNIVLDSKLIVDIRPVFEVDRRVEVTAHTFLSRLKITCRTARDVETKIYTLGPEEIDELLEALERARLKISSLKSSIGNSSLGIHLEHKK